MRRGSIHLAKAGAIVLPLLLAGLLLRGGEACCLPEDRWDEHLRPVAVDSSASLERLFDELDYVWPLPAGAAVPRIAIEPLPDDLPQVRDVRRKKSLFMRIVLPMVLAENARVLRQRDFLTETFATDLPPDDPRRRTVRALMREYRVKGDIDQEATRRELLRRVDIVPVSLVLAQAANESGWGTSRFAHQGNNLFGLWTYKQDRGIIPAARAAGAAHAVRRFPTLRASVRAHLHNINVGHAYEALRARRAQRRASGGAPDPLALAAGLERYSIRGQAYIAEIRAIIRSNRLRVLDSAVLRARGLQMASFPLRAGVSTDG